MVNKPLCLQDDRRRAVDPCKGTAHSCFLPFIVFAELHLPMTIASKLVSHNHQHKLPGWCSTCAVLFLIVVLCGCSPEEAIRQYTVPKDASSSRGSNAGRPQEILAAIVPGDEAWFFKLMGEPDKVDLYKDDFRRLVGSLSFASDGQPTWKLPEQWREEAGGEFVYRSLLPPSEKDLKITVSKLAMPADATQIDETSWRSYVVANVNRWRGQLQLSPQAWEEMSPDLEPVDKLSKATAPAYFVSLRGKASGGAMGGMSPSSGAPSLPAGAGAVGKRPTGSDIQVTLPEGWREVAPLSIMAIKSFEVDGPDGTKASATFTAAGGDMLSNVARWNGQVKGAEGQVEEALEKSEKFAVNGAPAQVVTLVGSEPDAQAIVAAKIDWSSQDALFVKLMGPATLVQKQRQAFGSLVKSLKW